MLRDGGGETIFSRTVSYLLVKTQVAQLSLSDGSCVCDHSTRILLFPAGRKPTATGVPFHGQKTRRLAPSESALSVGQRRAGHKKPDCFVFLITSCCKWQSLALGVASPRQPTESVAAWHFLAGYRSSSALRCEHDLTMIHFLFV